MADEQATEIVKVAPPATDFWEKVGVNAMVMVKSYSTYAYTAIVGALGYFLSLDPVDQQAMKDSYPILIPLLKWSIPAYYIFKVLPQKSVTKEMLAGQGLVKKDV
jgi:hypothetical protein